MAAITVQEINGPYEPSSDTTPLSTLTWSATNGTTSDTVTIPGQRVLVIVRNTDVATKTIAIASSYDQYGRKADIAATNVASGAIVARFFEPHGWEQSLGSGVLELTTNDAEMLVAAIAA